MTYQQELIWPRTDSLRIRVLGLRGQVDLEDSSSLSGFPPKKVVIRPAPENFGHLGYPDETGLVTADGVVINRRSFDRDCAFIGESRDCPFVLMIGTRRLGFVHVARDSLWLHENGDLLTNLVAEVRGDRKADELKVLIIGGISTQHFDHSDHPKWLTIVESLKSLRLSLDHEVVKDCKINLRGAIKKRLQDLGVKRINFWGDCTYSTPGLGSKRAQAALVPEKDRANWTVITRV